MDSAFFKKRPGQLSGRAAFNTDTVAFAFAIFLTLRLFSILDVLHLTSNRLVCSQGGLISQRNTSKNRSEFRAL